MAQRESLVSTARAAVLGNLSGFVTAPHHCAAFVRQVHQRVDASMWEGTEYNWDSDRDRDVDARDVERNMLSAGKRVLRGDLLAGDVAFFNHSGAGYGHVALYVGSGEIAENSTRTTGILHPGPGYLKLSRLPSGSTISSVCRLWTTSDSSPDDDLPSFDEVDAPIRWCKDQGYIRGDGAGHFVNVRATPEVFNTVANRAGLPRIEAAGSPVTRRDAQDWLDNHFAPKGIRIDLTRPGDALRLASLCYLVYWVKR